jgi:hypothetical protein
MDDSLLGTFVPSLTLLWNFHPTTSWQAASTAFLVKTKHQVYFSATTEQRQSIAHVNLFRKPSNSLILMAINSLIAICSIHLVW